MLPLVCTFSATVVEHMSTVAPAESLFQQLLVRLRPMFKAGGFRVRSQNFVTESSECWGVVNFQKSHHSTAKEKSFTINLAIAAKRILEYRHKSIAIPPPHYACHWETRIGKLLPDRQDKWWTISDEFSRDMAEMEVRAVLATSVIPLVKAYLSERGLMDLWQSNLSYRNPYPMLRDKSVLLALDGKLGELHVLFQAMRDICRGTRAEANMEKDIALLRNDFGLA
jgi:hypothetical protein